ncbi:MAG: flagellar hook-length control protein FliK [Marinobacter sp.]|uniref:flagellar hook-length control protein FliK n=1 Tax=Marinobacter sp. TaxID=50741 RepID=UPI003C456ABF
MSQMVLPQTPAPGAQPDTGGKKPSTGPEKSADSRFDSVSRAEQKRLDQKQADRRDDARALEQARQKPDERTEPPAEVVRRADTNESAGQASKTPTDDTPTETGETSATAEEVAQNGAAAVDLEPQSDAVALTFAELQALVVPAAGAANAGISGNKAMASNAGGLPGSMGQTPGMQGLAGVLAGLPGMKGMIPGNPADGGGKGASQSAGFQFAEALTALGAESGRAQDNTSLLASGRVQTLMDVSGQQLTSATAKLPADGAGLRGYATSVDVPVGHAEWGDKLIGKLAWLTANKLSVAEIHLTPPDMGPMEVRVQVQHEQANITVHSANPAVRDQLELHSHRLRDMLSEHGLSLEQFDVADSPQQQADGQDAGGESGNAGNTPDSDLAGSAQDELDVASGGLDLTWKGEIDIFA